MMILSIKGDGGQLKNISLNVALSSSLMELVDLRRMVPGL